jgi:hypothetical protein
MQTRQPEVRPDVAEHDILSRIRKSVQEQALYRQRGFVLAEDSRYIAAMIALLEAQFGVHVSNREITEENLGSVRAIARFVARKQPFAPGLTLNVPSDFVGPAV